MKRSWLWDVLAVLGRFFKRLLPLAGAYFLIEALAFVILVPETLNGFAFGALWAILLSAAVLVLPRPAGRIFYGITYYFFLLWTLAQTGYYSVFNRMMWLSDVFYAGEGADFLTDVLGAFPPVWWIGGVLLSAIMAAIMSTIDSQLLVTTSALTEDFYRRVIRRNASVTESVWVSRAFVVLITIAAMMMALFPSYSIFNIVKFAWGGFGAAFGPVVIMALYSKRTTWQAALAGMVAGTVVMLVWYFLGWNKYMYEILPGFVVNFIVVQKDSEITDTYDEMKKELKAAKTAPEAEKAEA